MIRLAWRFLMFQKDSETMIVALARELLIAPWRLAREGAIPEGIVLRPAL
jgi:transposase